jgi:hypothetical protein
VGAPHLQRAAHPGTILYSTDPETRALLHGGIDA